MTGRSLDETRRAFLLRLARGAALSAPVIATLRPDPAAAQGRGSARAQQVAASGSAVVQGGLSPAAGALQQEPAALEQVAPWEPAAGSEAPPWQRPPPTSSGG